MTARASRQPPLAAFVLHRYDWSESSLILDLFTREQGRIAVAAKGAKRPFSQLRGVLLPFQRLAVTLGRGGDESAREVHALRSVEWAGGATMLRGAALFNGFYVNELLLKLLARHDPHAALFDAYADTVGALGSERDGDGQPALRAFELVLLRETGLLADLAVETATQRPVGADERFRVLAESGVVRVDPVAGDDGDAGASGRTLAALQAALDARDLPALRLAAARRPGELRPLLRALLRHHLGGDDVLRTRRVLRDAQSLEG